MKIKTYSVFLLATILSFNDINVTAQTINPDVNVTTINVPVVGNVRTNDSVTVGTTYGTPVPAPGNPSGASIILLPSGAYGFQAVTTAGVYTYWIPICGPGVLPPPPCPATELKITVLDTTATNNPPVANTDLAGTYRTVPVTIKVLENDRCSNADCILNDNTGVTVTVAPTQGTAVVLVGSGGHIQYTPKAGFAGVDSFTYQVCDLAALCSTAQVFIRVVPVTAPNNTIATDDYVVTFPNVAVSGNVKQNDMDPVENGQVVTPQTTTTAAGTLVLTSDGNFTFTPTLGFRGTARFVYTVCDLQAPTACANATLYILVSRLAAVNALPVTLTDFKGVINNKQVVLTWRTSGEINSSHFDVLRSTDVTNFEKIGTVIAHGNSSVVHNYQLIDKTPAQGNNYYRLKSVDVDGKFGYSSVVKINLSDRTNGHIAVNPNPSHGDIRVNFNSMETGVYKVVLINQVGQVQLSNQVTISQNTEQRILKTQSPLAKGVYMLNIYKDGMNRVNSIKILVE